MLSAICWHYRCRPWTEDWLEKFAAQLARDQETYHVTLLGGDTTRDRLDFAHRHGLRPCPARKNGDAQGRESRRSCGCDAATIGEAALGLQVLQGKLEGDYPSLLQRYAFPQPRNALARPCCAICASAAMDISDGFIGDLIKLCGHQVFRQTSISKKCRTRRKRLPSSPAMSNGGMSR